MKILIIEDDAVKYGNVRKALEDCGVASQGIEHVVNAAEAIRALATSTFDVMLLDVNLPRRLGENTYRGGGLLVLKELDDDASLNRPRYIVGITAYEDVLLDFGDKFVAQLWSLVHYREDVDLWTKQLAALVQHIRLSSASHRFSDGVTFGYDVAIVCALPLELEAVRALPLDWTELRLAFDETIYCVGKVETMRGAKSVVCASAPRMGMPAASVLATKMIMQFRPRIIAMAGICAGRNGKTAIGDVIVADPSWDYGSGKIEGTDNGPKFSPSAHQLPLDPDIASAAEELARDVAWFAQLKKSFPGPKPPTELTVRKAPMASGAAVVADAALFSEIIDRQRNVLALEMEAYGVFAATIGSGRPRPLTLVAKAVCDFADKKKDDDCQHYAAFTSANVLVELLRRMTRI
ncbi:MAG: histidine kinase [Methylocystis sp.]|nr:MAG: histidine kinase [Methylocystis sp.]